MTFKTKEKSAKNDDNDDNNGDGADDDDGAHLAPDDRRFRVADSNTRQRDRLTGMSLIKRPWSYGKIRRI